MIAAIANSVPRKGGKEYKPTDFMPKFWQDNAKPTPQTLMEKMKAVFGKRK